MKIEWEGEEGELHELDVPHRFEVCPNCEGHGTHLSPSIREHAYSREEFEEAFFDDEDREAYFKRGGHFDVECETCRGQRVVEVPDESRLTDVQQQAVKAWQKCLADQAEWAREERREREWEAKMMGEY